MYWTGSQLPRKGHRSPLFLAHVYCGHGRPSPLLLSSCFEYCVVTLMHCIICALYESLFVNNKSRNIDLKLCVFVFTLSFIHLFIYSFIHLFECWTLRLQDISPTRHFAYDMDTSPTGQFAYETLRLLDSSPTPWTVRPLNVNMCCGF